LKSIFADYFDDWFIPFMGDDLVAKYISNVKKYKATFDVQKCANLGLKCARMCLGFGLRPVSLGEFERSPDLLAVIGVRGAYF